MAQIKVEEELSSFEARRQANIAKNKALFQELQLNAASANLGLGKTPKSRSAPSSNKKRTPVKKEDVGPRRTSSRLAGLTADSEVAKRKAEDEYVAIQQAAKVKRQRVEGDLDLKDVVVTGKGWDKSDNWLVDVVRGARPYERTFTDRDIKETSDKELKALRERMSGLDLYEGFSPNQIKITPERIYSLGFHPNPEKPVIFAGDKLGNLGIFDASQTPDAASEDSETEPVPNISTFHLHTRTISSMAFRPTSLITSSYDSSIRSLDLTTSKSVTLYSPPSADEDAPLSTVTLPDQNTLYTTTLDGLFIRHDTRTPSSEATTYMLSEKKIGGFSHHPLHPHLIATASLDRTLKLWDLRHVTGKGDAAMPNLLASHESRLSVSHAAFNAAGQIATASYDDTIKIHRCPEVSGSPTKASLKVVADLEPEHIVRHNNQTGRWVTILRAQWQERPQDGIQKFVIGNMNRFVDVYSGDGEQLAQLGGEGITAVPAVAMWHPTKEWVAAGTASGKLAIWM